MGRRTLLLIASILVAALGTSLLWLYVQGADARAQQSTELVPALFLTAPETAGTPATRLHVVTKRVPANVGGLSSLQPVATQQLKDAAVAGQVLLPGMFSTGPASSVPAQQVYVSITISDPHRTPALLKVGDTVAVYALAQQGSRSGAFVVANGIKVQTIGSSTQPGSNRAQVPVTIVGFSVTPDVAYQLVRIETYGQPELAILGPGASASGPPVS
jgi:pilus assembly protein CpaB